MTNWKNKWFDRNLPLSFLLGVVFFIVLTSVSLYQGNYIVLAVAFAPLLIYYSFFEFEKIYYFIIVATPFSVGLQWFVPQFASNVSLPSELLMAWMLMLIIMKMILSNLIPRKVFHHPISIAVLAYLFWMFVTSITSSMPLVSFKHFIARVWFIFPLFFFPVVLFRNKKTILKYFFLYIVPLSIVIIYTINKHLSFGLFDKKAAHFVMQPFYNDHTSYGAVLAMYLPIIAGLLFIYKKRPILRTLVFVFLILFSIAIVLSYTRAAWISVLGALVLWGMMQLKIKLKYLLFLGGFALVLLFSFRLEIVDKLSKNKQDSSEKLSEHVKSISNIATDASNKERMNRWNSAVEMIKERPFWGWGPGTYMFQYAPFQMAKDRTIISTNFGEGGNAHSEYLGPFAEQGLFGLLAILAIVIVTLHTGFSFYYHSKDKLSKQLVLISLLSLSTYFIHGIFNNYLDTDKASVPFWGMLAVITSLDLYSKE